ncbi:MAG: alpha/beta hydrolase [Lawsonibacter sp.]|nr:alpha/beta hydrolase [Lawsonibacter sp.]
MLKKWELTIPELTGDTPRRAYVYVPDAWEASPFQRYPVLYMFDGHNLFFDEDATYGKSWGLLNYMEETQTPLMIAAVECNHSPNHGRLMEYCPYTCEMPDVGRLRGKGKQYMDWLVSVFKPEIDQRFPTLPDRAHTFIAGSSMGGLMSLYAVMKYNKVFSRAAALSPSVWFGTEKLDKLLRTTRIKQDTVIYMDYGSRELGFHPNMADRFAAVTSILLERKIALTARIVPGGNHNEASWEEQIPFFLNTMLYHLD